MVATAGNTVRFTVGNQNAHNMFNKEDIVEGSKTRPKSENSKEALGWAIDRGNCDTWSLQELSSEKTLKGWLTDTGLAQKYPHVALVPGNSTRGINVGIISKYPIVHVESHKDMKFPLADGSGDTGFSRDLLRADIDVDGDKIADVSVYNTHSKSRLTSETGVSSDMQRLSEAKAIRDTVMEEMKEFPGRHWVVTGDLNDECTDPSVQALLDSEGKDPWRDSLDHLAPEDRKTWPASPKPNKWGHLPAHFDHVIYDADNSKLVSSKILDYNLHKDGFYQSWGSDHKGVKAEFEITPSGGGKLPLLETISELVTTKPEQKGGKPPA